MAYAPRRSEITRPITTIQMRWFRAAAFSIIRLNRGSKRKIAKTSAPVKVPNIPAKFPNRAATKKITIRNTRGAKLVKGVWLMTGVNPAAATAQHPAPTEADCKRDMPQ